MKRTRIKKSEQGYTLIETMIAVTLFLVIAISGMGALLNANLLHRKSQSMRSILDSLNFVMEDMSRNMRTGEDFQCFRTGVDPGPITPASMDANRSCASGWALAFDTQDGDRWVYYGYQNAIWKSTDGALTFIRLTPPEVRLTSDAYTFAVLGAEPQSDGDAQQPLITIRLTGEIIFRGTEVTPFAIQTSVSERELDYGD